MALSQKYDGVVLMPWFNLAEWKSVKELIFSEDYESHQVAVDRMKVWKLRTHQIPVGIDGTLELLEALLAEKNNLSHNELVRIYSISLLRFLNICAGNNEKQGTFYKTAEKNGLPLWLITLRHDIAHDPTIPSKSYLKQALIQCLQWVKEKYWESSQMEDFDVSEESNFKELINYYAKLKLLNFYNEATYSLIAEIKKKMGCSLLSGLNRGVPVDDFIILLEDHLIQSVTRDKIKDSSLHIVSTLVEEEIIFSVDHTFVNGAKRIPFNFLSMWHKLLNLLYKNGTLFMLVNKLGDVIESTTHESSVKEISSIWIAELYRGLLKTKNLKDIDDASSKHLENMDKKTAKQTKKSESDTDPQFDDSLTFDEFEMLPLDDCKLFQERTSKRPTEYTINYLEIMMKINGEDESYIKKKMNLFRKLQFSTASYTDPVTIYSIEDLKNLQEKHSSEPDMKDCVKSRSVDEIEVRKRFRPLSDAEKFSFKCYPLGYMPQK